MKLGTVGEYVYLWNCCRNLAVRGLMGLQYLKIAILEVELELEVPMHVQGNMGTLQRKT